MHTYISIFLPISSVLSLSCVRSFATPWVTACQASLSITNSQSLLKPMSIELVMPCNHLILCHPLLLLPPIRPSIRVFSSESTLHMRWPKYWSFSFSISPSNDCMYLHDIHACDFTFDICVYAYAFPDGLVCAQMCKPPQAYNCSYTCIRVWTQIHACPCSHMHKCTFVVECRDWRREFSACLLADTVHNKCRKTISQRLKISNLRSTCVPWSQPEQLKLRRLPRMMGEVPGLNFLE